MFNEINENLPNGKVFRVTAKDNTGENIYIQQAFINGRTLNTSWFTHDNIINGSILELEMGKTPNKLWKNSSVDSPPASLNYVPSIRTDIQ